MDPIVDQDDASHPDPQRAALLGRLGLGEAGGGLLPGRSIALWRTLPRPAPDPPSVAPRLAGISTFVTSRWDDSGQDAAEVEWVDGTAAGFLGAGVATEAANAANHLGSVESARVRRLYGADGYERLAALKARYDPGNVFHRNYNIPPAGSAATP